jgi:N utilization substance protein A
VRQVVNELRGEKVDVVQWRENVGQFIAEALGPAKVKEVKVDEANKVADVVVSEHQLSLAIGKEGQNARLAARLSGYKVDIRSDHVVEVVEEAPVSDSEVPAAPEEAGPEEAAAEETAPDETSEEAPEVVEPVTVGAGADPDSPAETSDESGD